MRCGLGDDDTQHGFHLGWFFFRNHASVEFEDHAPRHHIGVGPAFDLANIQVGVANAFHLRADVLVQIILGIQRAEDANCGLQGVNTRSRNSGVRHSTVDRNLELQAAIVGRDHLVTEAGGNHQVGFDDVVAQQPGRAEFATELLVVSEQQFHAARLGSGNCLQRKHSKCVGGKI